MDDFIFTLNPQALGWLVTLVASLLTLLFAAKIPLKRRYHYLFIIYLLVMILFSAAAVFAQMADNAEAHQARVWWQWFFTVVVQVAPLYHSTLLFVSPHLARMKYTLLPVYGYVLVRWGMLLVNPSLIFTTPRSTLTGWISGPGSLNPYTTPSGINYYVIILAVVVSVILIGYYKRQQSSVVRIQLRYLVVGWIIIAVASNTFTLTQYLGGFPIHSYFFAAAMVVLLLGIMKHGFLAITPRAELQSQVPPRYKLAGGYAYLASEPGPRHLFGIFTNLAFNGHSGLCITRSPPDNIRQIYKLKTTPILWLTEEKGDDAVAPSDLHGLLVTIKAFLERAERSVVMLQGIGYLASINGFKPVMRLITRLGDANLRRDGIMILSATPGTLTERQITMLNGECPWLQRLDVSQNGEATTSPPQPIQEIHPLLMKNASVPAKPRAQEPFEFKLNDAQKVFRFLAKAFLQDYTVQKIFIDNAGWRSLSEIAIGAALPISKMYGRGREPGLALAELIKRGLAETKWLSGQRGRGGETMKVRVNYGNPYVKAEIDRFALQP